MPVLTIRNVSDETLCALSLRAARNARSVAAEVRAIIDEVVRPEERPGIGSQLAALGRQFGGIELVVRRDPEPVRGAKL
jgi:plasmid stability protein